MIQENRESNRRTMTAEVRRLSILERRCSIRRQRVEKSNRDFTIGSIGFPVFLVGIVVSYVYWISVVSQ